MIGSNICMWHFNPQSCCIFLYIKKIMKGGKNNSLFMLCEIQGVHKSDCKTSLLYLATCYQTWVRKFGKRLAWWRSRRTLCTTTPWCTMGSERARRVRPAVSSPCGTTTHSPISFLEECGLASAEVNTCTHTHTWNPLLLSVPDYNTALWNSRIWWVD